MPAARRDHLFRAMTIYRAPLPRPPHPSIARAMPRVYAPRTHAAGRLRRPPRRSQSRMRFRPNARPSSRSRRAAAGPGRKAPGPRPPHDPACGRKRRVSTRDDTRRRRPRTSRRAPGPGPTPSPRAGIPPPRPRNRLPSPNPARPLPPRSRQNREAEEKSR